MLRGFLSALILVLPLAAPSGPAAAATFDIIYHDKIVVTLPDAPSSINGLNFNTDVGLIVNKGSTDILGDELFSATFTATTSNPSVQAVMALGRAHDPTWWPFVVPIVPEQATGNLMSGSNLPSQLLPGETLHNVSGDVLGMGLEYPPLFVGEVTCEFTMIVGGNAAHFTTLADFQLGTSTLATDIRVSFPTAARVSSVPLTPAVATTWGKIKRLYR